MISPAGNFNYSVSYLFNAGPFSHTGFKIDYSVTENLSFLVAFTNPHGITDGTNPTDDQQLGLQLGYKNHFFNLVYGADGFGSKDVLYLDYTSSFKVSKSFSLGANVAYSNSSTADAGYYGAALYLMLKMSEKTSVGLRPEYYVTKAKTEENKTSAVTLTGKTALSENLNVIAEFRYDQADDSEVFKGRDHTTGITIAAVYSFK